MNWNRTVGRRSLLKAVGAGAGAYLVGGCSSPQSPSTAPAAPAGGAAPGAAPAANAAPQAAAVRERAVRMLAVTAQGLFEQPNPFGSRTGPGIHQASYLFDSLLWRDSTVDPIPWLAEKWTRSADGIEWTFDLRDGIRFQDGQPLTADDVAFTYQYLASNPTNNFTNLADLVKEVKAVDPRTVSIVLKNPYAPFANTIAAALPILPKHIWSSVTDPKKYNDPKAFMGSGPYRLSGMNEADASFLFTANESFFLGKPYVQRIEFAPVGDDLAALKAGKLDEASTLSWAGLTNEALAPFKSDPRFTIVQAPGDGVVAVYFNQTRGAPYNDVRFRRAVCHGIDRQELINRVLTGNGEVGSPGCLSSSNPFAAKDLPQYPYDPSKAKALLDEAGIKEVNGERRMPDGSALQLPILFASNQARVAEFIKAQLTQVGLKTEMRSVDPGTASQLQDEGNYFMAVLAHGGTSGEPDSYLFRAFNSPDTARSWQKAWGYKSSEFDRLAKEQRRTIDVQKRTGLLQQLQRILSEDLPIIHLYYPNRYIIFDPKVFDAWYFTPLSNPLAMNKHFFVTGNKTGLEMRKD